MTESTSPTFNRNLIVAVLLSAAFVSVLNQTLLLVAVPPIMEDFQIEASVAQWVTTAFLLTNGILIPITAFLIEKFTSRALLITALSLFTVGTILGAVAPTFTFLLVARIFQAAGAGILMPMMQTIILTLFPLEKRGAAMGIVGLVVGFAPAIGPTLSGWIIDHFTWRHLFYLVIPAAMVVLLLALFLMKNVTTERNVNIDIHSAISSTLGWGGLLYGFSMAGSFGWSSLSVVISLIIGALSLTWFIKRQLRLETPMLEFRVFQSRIFMISTILSVLMFVLMIGTQTLLPIYAQNVRGISALDSGLILLPGAIIMGMMSPLTGKIFDKIGGRGLAITGFLLIFISTLLFTGLKMDTSIPAVAVVFAMMMIGNSMIMMPVMTAGMNALNPELIAHGTAMQNTIRMVGGSIGTALLVTVMSNTAASASSSQTAQALLTGLRMSFLVAGMMALTGVIAAFRLHKKKAAQEATLHSHT